MLLDGVNFQSQFYQVMKQIYDISYLISEMKKCLYIENPLLLPNYYTLGMGLHDTGCPRQGQGRADKNCPDFRCQRRFKMTQNFVCF